MKGKIKTIVVKASNLQPLIQYELSSIHKTVGIDTRTIGDLESTINDQPFLLFLDTTTRCDNLTSSL